LTNPRPAQRIKPLRDAEQIRRLTPADDDIHISRRYAQERAATFVEFGEERAKIGF